VTIPLAVYLTRFIASYRLLDAGYSVPGGAALALLAIVLARRSRRDSALALGRANAREGIARAGYVLGVAGLCIALAGVVALAVYELLQHQGASG